MEEICNKEKFIKEGVEYSKADIESKVHWNFYQQIQQKIINLIILVKNTLYYTRITGMQSNLYMSKCVLQKV